MTNNTGEVKMWECPSPDCSFATGGSAELLEHVNSEHPGEYQRDDWPDTDAARAKKQQDGSDESAGE
ncbi:hypothetical protein [Natrinema versiforme]|uniref:C2H2-type domain-containing protein n=1 Tax=Natrinema versiforme TaxID=88724 RepID=A0A4P8WM67_9EURY|nr:hypothetical protein [Natrinema versiforme]QCS44668.1 hypothetical protein FEJ81_20400 [Natrinema versiforme]